MTKVMGLGKAKRFKVYVGIVASEVTELEIVLQIQIHTNAEDVSAQGVRGHKSRGKLTRGAGVRQYHRSLASSRRCMLPSLERRKLKISLNEGHPWIMSQKRKKKIKSEGGSDKGPVVKSKG